MKNFQDALEFRKTSFEKFFQSVIFSEIKKTFHPLLAEACIYSLSAGGKMFRPVLAISAYISSSKDIDLERGDIYYLASALECIHTYSLIHDDLPSMDNDNYRRGILTNHKKFSESTAILAGDALNSFAFNLLKYVKNPYFDSFLNPSLDYDDSMELEFDPFLHRDLIHLLHEGSGGPGMVSGQIEDIESEKLEKPTGDILHIIHAKKTGALITASLLLGNRLGSDWVDREAIFREYGEKLGLLFQITDDILDEESNLSELGKTPGKDKAKGKLTFPSLYGMEKAKKSRDQLTKQLKELSKNIIANSDKFFQFLPDYIAERKK
jgi:geranylgeranyl diphosphate synthase type II